MGMRVWECGGSECPAVVVGIEADALTRKGADFHWVRDNKKGMVSLIVRKANKSICKVRCAPDPGMGETSSGVLLRESRERLLL